MSAAEKLPPLPSKPPPQRPMRPADLGGGWTPEGLEQLRRVLERAVRGGR